MNILYLNNEMTIGGVAKCILKLSKELKKDNNIFIASKKNGALLPEFEKLGIYNYPIVDVKSKAIYNIVTNILRLVRIVKEKNIDIIHSHHRMTTLLAKEVSKIISVKVMHTQHLCIEDKFKLTNFALSNLKIITVSESAKRILIEKSNLEEENISTIYNSIETEVKNKEVENRILNAKENGFFIVAQISRIIQYKGVYDFIEIGRKVTSLNNNIKFVLIGNGPDLNNIKEFVHKEKLENNIFLLGAKDNVIEYLKYVDVLVLCSYIEGLPLAPIEAFSQGVPVIATNIPGTNEEIQEGINGYLVEPKDIEGFKEKILKLYNDQELLFLLKKNSKNIYEKLFNPKVYIQKHVEIYKKIIKNN